MPEVVLPPYLQSVLALRPPPATSTRTDLAPSFKLLHSTVNSIYGVSGIRGLEPGLWRAQLLRITLRSAQLIEAVWSKLGGQVGVITDDQGQGGTGVMKLQSVFADLQMFIGSLTTIQDPLSTLLLDPVAFSRTQATVTSLSKKLFSLIQHYQVADLLPTPIGQWPAEDAEDKDEDLAALPVLIAKSRPNKAILQSFQEKCAQEELSSSTNVDIADQDAQVTPNALSQFASSATSPLHSSSHANSGLSTAKRSEFLRFVYSQNPNLIGNQANLDSAVAAGSVAVSSMTPSPKVSLQSLSKSQDGYKQRKSLVQQRISSFATLTDAPPPLPSSILNPLSAPRRIASDNPSNPASRKGWTVDMRGLNNIQRQASLSSSKPPSHSVPPARILVATPPVNWKSSASCSASLKSSTSSIAESLSCSRSSNAEIFDSKYKTTEKSVEDLNATTSDESEGASKGPPIATFAEQAAAIVASRKQRGISQSSFSSLLSRERHHSTSKSDLNASNGPPGTLGHSVPNDIKAPTVADPKLTPTVPSPKPEPNLATASSKPDTELERALSSNSCSSSGSGYVSVSNSTSASLDVTTKLAINTNLTDSISSLEPPSSSLTPSLTTNSKVDSMPPSISMKGSTSTSHPSSSVTSPTSPAPGSFNVPPVALSESGLDLELVPDLIEHASFLDVIFAPTDANVDHLSKRPSEPAEPQSTPSPIKLVPPPRSPNRPLFPPKPSSSQSNDLPADESTLADLMEQVSMFESWTPDQEHAVEQGRESTPSIGSTVHPTAPTDSKAVTMPCTVSPSLSPPQFSPRSPHGSVESKSELMRSLSTTSISPVLKPSSMSLRPIDPILTSLPEGNRSTALLSLAGSACSTPSASGNSWATSFISNSPMFPDLDCNFLNGSHIRDQLSIPPPENPLKTGWRILCLDGGGVRGLSMLYLVRELMLSIQSNLRLERTPLPCEIFEMICGVGTGGIIALLLGRLRLSISLAIPAYLQVVRQVFGHSKGVIAAVRRTTRFSASKLEAVIQEVVNRISGNPELPMAAEGTVSACRTFVISTRSSENKGERASFIKLRSYSHGPIVADTCSIAQAARATSAAPLFFKPPKLDDEDNRVDFVPTDTTVNNPSFEAVTEAETLFPGRPIDCLVSLGAGIGIYPGSGSIARACSEMLESCERTAQDVELKSRREGWNDKYFRFTVNGLKNEDRRGEWHNPDSVKAETSSYIFAQEQEQFNKQIRLLSNSWKGAYEDEVWNSLVKAENKLPIMPHSATLPPRNSGFSTEKLKRSTSQIEIPSRLLDKTSGKAISSECISQNPAMNKAPDFKRSSPLGASKFMPTHDNNLQNGLSVQPNLNDSSISALLNLKLPEFDFSKA